MGILSCKLLPSRDMKTNDQNDGSYMKKWLVQIDEASRYLHGKTILEMCRSLEPSNNTDPVDAFEAPFRCLDAEDNRSYARTFEVKAKSEDEEDWDILNITANFEPREDDEGGGQQVSLDPFDFRPLYWTEQLEIEVPIEDARCMTYLASVARGLHPLYTAPPALFGEDHDPDAPITIYGVKVPPRGPIVNACGQQTIDPLKKTIYNVVLYAKRNYPTALHGLLLNREYGHTVNATDKKDPKESTLKFLGHPGHMWRYLITKSDEREGKEVLGQYMEYYPTTTAIEFSPLGWDLKVLNNGMSRFDWLRDSEGSALNEPIIDPITNRNLLLPTIVKQLKEEFDLTGGGQPTKNDLETLPSSEPVNLDLQGIQMEDPKIPAEHITYWDYEDKDFNQIPPYYELIQEYHEFTGEPIWEPP